MMVSADKKRILPELNLLGLGTDFKSPLDWIPKGGQVSNPLSPGLKELTKGREYNRLGLTEKDFSMKIRCRFCGSDMFIVEETNDAIVWGCPYELCPNNPDGPFSNYYYERAKRKVGTIREDQFGE